MFFLISPQKQKHMLFVFIRTEAPRQAPQMSKYNICFCEEIRKQILFCC